MEQYKDYLIDPKAFGKDDNWEPRFTVYSANGLPVDGEYQILGVHETTHAAAVETAIRTAKRFIDEEMG